MSRGYSGANVIAELEIEYNYMGHDFDEYNDITNLMEMNLYFAKDTDNYSTNIEHIMNQAVEYAKNFVKQNLTWDTGRLYHSIEARRISSDHWQLIAPARDEREHLYAGHIEYGFTDKAGQAHGPWPFLRPAMRLAAMDSRGELEQALAQNILYGPSFNGISPWNIAFGRSNNIFSVSKSQSAHRQLFNNYRRYDDKKNKWVNWGYAKNGFNDYSGRLDPGTSRNQWSTSSADDWDWGAL